ncbi:hypothetical protein Skr01_36230 [Sphaerisporangium krabiense]|uniref:Uncharacterized protein n=1 Tax=Sphaerisporangium krabiense TaxID=763782 RepID=A0A7W9DPN0_9ACTN|nr:hypothetical protein [Sphaerisporangium krabiense]MBB5626616.1 hypothetical protein [Sphaerisporangium krabiense]GII63538.1 hypothetical protein Skr01_36230 [Sphaerisporangium krabiense]
MTTARTRSIAARREADMLDACAVLQEALADAKQAYEADPSEETLTARRDAMAKMHEFRAFIRSVARVRQLRHDLAHSSLLKARPDLRAAAERELARLEPEFGAFADGQGPPSLPRPSDAQVQAKTIRGRGRANTAGGA